MTFDHKIVWITGASSGIGKELALQLSQKNCKLILSARRKEVLEQVQQECAHPEQVKILPLDLEQYDDFPTTAQKAVALFGHVDILVNNGGISQRSKIMETNMTVYKRVMEIDYLGTIALSKAILPHFIERQSGLYVVISSVMGKYSSAYRSGYCGAKHALHGFFDALRMEHEQDGVGVTLICPGFVNTNVARNAFVGDGSKQGYQDKPTENGLNVTNFVKRMIRAVQRNKYEAYIGGKESLAIYVKRFFPRLLHRIVIKSEVR